MPPALNWKYVGTQTFAAGTISASHAALAALGAKTTYPDGTARTPGTGSAWTWTLRSTAGTNDAVTGVPPAATNTFNWAYIVAGSASTAASNATMCSPHISSVANCITVGMNRNTTGAYTTWNSTTPFTTAGQFTGYWPATVTFVTTFDTVVMWEAQDSCLILYAVSSSGQSGGAMMGGWIDPVVEVPGTTCETDGRLYGLTASGSNSVIPSTWLSTNNAAGGFLGNYSATNRYASTGYITPGTSTLAGNNLYRFDLFGSAWPSVTSASRDGSPIIVPFGFTNVSTGRFVGQTRSFGVGPYLVNGAGLYDKTSVYSGINGWIANPSTSGVGPSLLLRA